MKKIFTRILLLGTVLVCGQSCFHARINHQMVVQDAKGDLQTYVYGESVNVAGHGLGCIVTGWYYGGWCWAYLMMPFQSDRYEIASHARLSLRANHKGAPYTVVDESTEVVGWFNTSPRLITYKDPESRFIAAKSPVTELNVKGDAAMDATVAQGHDPKAKLSTIDSEPEPSVWFDISPFNVVPRPRHYGYISVDAGTSFSPHGVGLNLGAAIDPLMAEVGYGLQSKNGKAGNPKSVGLYARVYREMYVGGSYTRYAGSGRTPVQFASGRTATVDADWLYEYARVSARGFGKLGYRSVERFDFRFYWEVGYAQLCHSHFWPPR